MNLQWLGFVGLVLVMAAYLPQAIHLLRARCTAGVSLGAYMLWTTAAFLVLVYALSVRDWVFIALQSYQLAASSAVFALAARQKGRLCSMHCGEETLHPIGEPPLGA